MPQKFSSEILKFNELINSVEFSCNELLQPSDRLKTEEEIAKEEKEKLEALEVSN